MATLEIDNMEYASDALAIGAYISSDIPVVTGDVVTTFVGNDVIFTFNGNGSFTPVLGGSAKALIVAGGGGGGSDAAGGGGGGGLIYNASVSLTNQTYPIVIGGGGSGGIGTYNSVTDSTNGGNSSFASLTAIGGGGGGGRSTSYKNGHNGGSGGGASHAAGVGTPGDADYISPRQGYDGGNGEEEVVGAGGGGGGAGAVGGDVISTRVGGIGGVGLAYDITGTSTYYAGGGGGSGTTGSSGGLGGGGNGGESGKGGYPGTPNTGGGGGGGYYAVDAAGSGTGGSGIVVIRYTLPETINVFSESAIKTQGSYSLKCIALQNLSENKTLTKTFSTHSDLTGVGYLRFDMRSIRIGSNIKLTLHNSNDIITELTPNILTENVFQEVIWNISAVADADKNDIDQFIITVINADADNTFYLDYFGIYSGGAMTQVKVSQLTPVTAIADDDLLLVSQDVGGGSFVSKSIPGSVIRGTTGSYITTFTNSDLVANILTVTHNLNETHALSITIENNSGKMLGPPDDVVYVGVNSLTIDFTSLAPLTGTWYIRVSKGSGLSSSVDMGQAWALNG
jgi:hypothetical protein